MDVQREDGLTVEGIARRFHEAYERLAPDFNYETRPESAVPWDDVPEANRLLMQAVVADVFGMFETVTANTMGHAIDCDGRAEGRCSCSLADVVMLRQRPSTPTRSVFPSVTWC